MKTLTGHKSLLLGSGLLLISLVGLRLGQLDRTDIPSAQKAKKKRPIPNVAPTQTKLHILRISPKNCSLY